MACPIHKGTLCLFKYEIDIHVFVFENVYFYLWVLCKSVLRIFCSRNREAIITIKHFSSPKKRSYLTHYF